MQAPSPAVAAVFEPVQTATTLTALVLALARRDAAGAARLMREHLKGTEQVPAGLMP